MRRTLLALCLLLVFAGFAPAQEVKIPPCPTNCPCPCSAGLPCTCGHPVVEVSGVQAKTATLLVSLPADATLTVNGHATRARGNRRVFRTPALEKGGSYTLRARVVRNGQTLTRERAVRVNPGNTARVSFDLPRQAAPVRSYAPSSFGGWGCAGGACGVPTGLQGGFMRLGGGGCSGGRCR